VTTLIDATIVMKNGEIDIQMNKIQKQIIKHLKADWDKPEPKSTKVYPKAKPEPKLCLWCHQVRDSKSCKCKEAAEYEEALHLAHVAQKYGWQTPDEENKDELIAWSKKCDSFSLDDYGKDELDYKSLS
jgi:hypothetical protein